MKIPLEHPIFPFIAQAAKALNVPTYAVGGWVRDQVIGRPTKDIDVVCVGSGIELAEKTAELIDDDIHVNFFKNFGTAQFIAFDTEIEFVGARKESYQRDSRKPIVEEGTLEDDQNRRDFTINALAVSLNATDYGQLIDPFGGLEDIDRGIVKTPLEPNITFSDDPLRMMRAIRFSTQLQYKIEDNTYQAIKDNADRISIISKERIIDELNKIILSPKPSLGFKKLFDTGLLHLIFPEMTLLHGVEFIGKHGHKDNFYHTLQVLDNISENTNDLWLRWAAVMHDIAKPQTKKYDKIRGWTFDTHEYLGSKMVPRIFRKMKLPMNEKMRFVQKLVLLHLRPISLTKDNITDSAIRRLLFEAGDDIDALMTLCDADITSKNKEKKKRFLRNFALVRIKLKEVEEKDQVRNFQPPISGAIIMKTFDIKPCKEVGDIKNQIKEAILEGDIKNDYQEAFNLMLQLGKELGLKEKVN